MLEIGCGTGTVAEMMAQRGAHLTAIDQNPQMLEIARRRLANAATVTLHEQTACEIDRFGENAFDAVVASLCLSEMSVQERAYVFAEARKLLARDGVLVVGDEVVARGLLQRALQWCLRLPQALLGWAMVGSVSHPIRDLAGELERVGFRVRIERRYLLGTLALVVAEPC